MTARGDNARDGPGPLYWKSKRRLLLLLKEPTQGGNDLWHLLRNGPENQIWRNVARWATGVLRDFPRYDSLPSQWNESFYSVALVNLKKSAGGTKSVTRDVRSAADRGQDNLRRQIRKLRPHIVLACGAGVFDAALDLSLLPGPYKLERSGKKIVGARIANGAVVIKFRHPNRAGQSDYVRLRRIARELKVTRRASERAR